MSAKVLIVIDSVRRELFGCSLLAKYLKDLGLQPILCSRLAFENYYAHYCPDAVIWPNAFPDFSEIGKTCHIFVLPAESGNGQPDQVIATHAGQDQHKAHPKSVDKFFCWGHGMRDILLETNTWHSDQLVVTGNPSTDQWLLPISSNSSTEPIAGMTTTFRALCNSVPPKKMNYFEWLDNAELSGSDGTYYRPPEHAESWLFFEASLARVLGGLVRTFSGHSKRFEIRPHPGVQMCRYQYFSDLSQGYVSVNKEGTITEWLKNISLLFTCTSASALDAVVRGVPVVSLKGLMDPDALRKIPNDFHYNYEPWLWQLEDLNQAVDYFEKAVNGDLPLCQEEAKLSDFLSQNFHFPRECPSARQIAVEIKRVMDEDGQNKIKNRNLARSGIKQTVQRHFPMYAQARAFEQYLHSLRPSRQDLGFTYQPWRFWEYKKTKQLVEQLWSADHI